MTADAIKIAINTFSVNFISILYEALPFIILGAIIAGILEEMLPQQLISRVLPKRRWMAIMLGGLLGLVFPMCECGIIPVMRRLLRKGLPLSCCIAYLLAGPIINIIVMLSTYVAFTGTTKVEEDVPIPEQTLVYTPPRAAALVGLMPSPGLPGSLAAVPGVLPVPDIQDTTPLQYDVRNIASAVGMGSVPGVAPIAAPPALLLPMQTTTVTADVNSFQLNAFWMMALRVALGYLIAVTTALIVDRQYQKYGNSLLTPLAVPPPQSTAEEGLGEKKPWLKRISNISETALHDFIDITVFLILGALLAATVKLLITDEQIEALSLSQPWLAILGMMLMAIVLCLCSEADAFVAASFTKLVPAAKLAFLVLGPMMDFKLYFMYTRVFRPRLIWTIIISVIVQVFVYCFILHMIWQAGAPEWMGYTTS